MNFDSGERMRDGPSTNGLFFKTFCNNEEQGEHDLGLPESSAVDRLDLTDEISSHDNQKARFF
jgi:hypothetical protein